jgi:hypothetical protein
MITKFSKRGVLCDMEYSTQITKKRRNMRIIVSRNDLSIMDLIFKNQHPQINMNLIYDEYIRGYILIGSDEFHERAIKMMMYSMLEII